MRRPPSRVGAIAVLLALVVALISTRVYEAWWTALLVPLVFVLVWVERLPLSPRDVMLSAAGVITSLALGGYGLLATVIGLSGPSYPCGPDCHSPLLLPGIGLQVLAIAGLITSNPFIRRQLAHDEKRSRSRTE